MQKIKFDFEATKQIIDVAPDASVRIGAPVNANGVLANDTTAIGVVLDAQGVGVHRQLVVMVAGYCDIIDAQAIWGDEYSAEAMAAMSDIKFCDNHELPTGGGGGVLDDFLVVNITTDPEISIDKTYDELQNAEDRVLPIVDNKIAQFYGTGGLVQFISLTDTYDGFTYLIVTLTEDGEATLQEAFIPFGES